jgi:putative intracellular protease/amidase
MKRIISAAAPILLGLALFAGGARAESKHYVCTPCNQPCDAKVFDQPGTCPGCGMALIDQEAAKSMVQARKKAAILIFDGVEIIDYTGPYEVFGAARFEVYTVAASLDPVTTAMGMTVVPKYTFATAPAPDVLVVPGGGVRAVRESASTLKWVTETARRAEHTMSICNGAFILASAGLLDGLTATTTYHLIGSLAAEYPKVKVVDDQRFVDNGKILTTAGLSSGIDGALHVVSEMLGPGRAQTVALGIEYNWHPDHGFVRAALADKLIPELGLEKIGKWDIVRTEGGTDRWELEVRGTSDSSAAELRDYLGRALVTQGKWTNIEGKAAGSQSPSNGWRFTDRDGKPWTGTLKIESLPGAGREYTAKVTIARAG